MSPRTNSPPPSYGPYDDINDYDYYPSGTSRGSYLNNINQASVHPSQQQQSNITPEGTDISRSDIAGAPTTRDNSQKNERGIFSALLLRPLDVSRRVLSSSAVKYVSLTVLYSFCISAVCFIFFVSYFLTFYDDARKLFRSSRVWARLKSGVRERIAMMGDDWEDFLQKYFDQWDVDRSNVNHGGDNNNTANKNNTDDTSSKRNSSASPTGEGIPTHLEWEDWLKGAVLSFMTAIAGQEATNEFKHSFRGQQSTTTSTTTGSDTGRR